MYLVTEDTSQEDTPAAEINQTTTSHVADQTTLVPNEDEAFALEPIDITGKLDGRSTRIFQEYFHMMIVCITVWATFPLICAMDMVIRLHVFMLSPPTPGHLGYRRFGHMSKNKSHFSFSGQAGNLNKSQAQTFFYLTNMKYKNDLFDFGKKVPPSRAGTFKT